jgi:hypothetical protein
MIIKKLTIKQRAAEIKKLEAEHGKINKRLNELRLEQQVEFSDMNTERMRKVSGAVTDDRLLVAFLYTLMRDAVTPGHIESIMLSLSNAHNFNDKTPSNSILFTNGWLANYAKDIAQRLENNPITNDSSVAGSRKAPAPLPGRLTDSKPSSRPARKK